MSGTAREFLQLILIADDESRFRVASQMLSMIN